MQWESGITKLCIAFEFGLNKFTKTKNMFIFARL